MSDLQDIIATSSIRAFNSGLEQGRAEERKRITDYLQRIQTWNAEKSATWHEGYLAGIEKTLDAARFVSFERDDLTVASLDDLYEELRIRLEQDNK